MTRSWIAALAATAPADGAATAAGTWNMGLQGGHVVPVALVLTQDGSAAAGTVAMPAALHALRLDGLESFGDSTGALPV